jgi:hypothetical protein
VVAGERGRLRLDDLIGDEDDVTVAAITVAELLVGVELADATNQSRRRVLVDSIVATIPVEDYDLDVARSHASCSLTPTDRVVAGARTTWSSPRPPWLGAGSSSPPTGAGSATSLGLRCGSCRGQGWRAERGRRWSGARTTMVPFMPAAQWPRTWQP